VTANDAVEIAKFPPDMLKTLLRNSSLRADYRAEVAACLLRMSGEKPFEHHELAPFLSEAQARVTAEDIAQSQREQAELFADRAKWSSK
jgi:hypothetical protein